MSIPLVDCAASHLNLVGPLLDHVESPTVTGAGRPYSVFTCPHPAPREASTHQPLCTALPRGLDCKRLNPNRNPAKSAVWPGWWAMSASVGARWCWC